MNRNKVYVIQDIPGTREGRPKINIIGATEFGELKVLLPENAQIILSAGPLVFKLRKSIKKIIQQKITFYSQATLQLLELHVQLYLILPMENINY